MNKDTNKREREKGNSLPMIHEIKGRDSTVGLHNLMVDFIFFSGGFRSDTGPRRAPYVISLAFRFLSLSLSLSLEGRQVSSVFKRGDKCTRSLRMTREGKTCNGRESTLPARNLNLNPVRGRSRAVTDPKICIWPTRERG